jgi:hypothetical protein
MGYGISWVAVGDNKENALLDVLGLEKTGETEDTPDSEWSTTRIGDWTVVWSNLFEPKKFRHASSKFKGEVIICDVEEHIMYSSVAAFKEGDLSWRVVHNAQQTIDHLSIEGSPPKSLPKIQAEQVALVSEGEPDHIFDIPIRLAQELVGFRYDEPVARTFEVLRSKPGWKFW